MRNVDQRFGPLADGPAVEIGNAELGNDIIPEPKDFDFSYGTGLVKKTEPSPESASFRAGTTKVSNLLRSSGFHA